MKHSGKYEGEVKAQHNFGRSPEGGKSFMLVVQGDANCPDHVLAHTAELICKQLIQRMGVVMGESPIIEDMSARRTNTKDFN